MKKTIVKEIKEYQTKCESEKGKFFESHEKKEDPNLCKQDYPQSGTENPLLENTSAGTSLRMQRISDLENKKMNEYTGAPEKRSMQGASFKMCSYLWVRQ